MSTPNSRATLQWLKHRFAPAKKTLVLAALLAVVTSLSGMALLGVAGWFIGAAALAGLAGTGLVFNMFGPSAGIRGFAISRTGARYLERLVSHDGTFRIMQSLRAQLFSFILPRIPGPLSGLSQGHLLERLLGDVERLEGAWLEQAQPAILASVISLLLLITLIVTGQTAGATVFVALLILLSASLLFLNRNALAPIQRLAQHKEELRSEVVQALTGLPEVVAYNIKPRLAKRWQHQLQDVADIEHQLVRRQSLSAALIQGGIQLLAVVILLLAIPLVANDTLSAPTALATLLLFIAAVEVFQPLARAVQRWAETRSTVARMEDIENSPAPAKACAGSLVPETGDTLSVTGLTFGWQPDNPTFEEVTFTVTPDTPLAIIGPSGVGKSSLLHCLMGLQKAQQGSIEFGNVKQIKADEQAWRNQFSLLLQQQQLFTGTLRDNLLIANEAATDDELWNALRLSRIDDLVKQRGGLDFTVGPEGLHLSGGQTRRLALARVLLRDSPIVLLDEPFTGLEKRTADQLLNDIQNALKGKILIMVTHHKEHSHKLKQTIYL